MSIGESELRADLSTALDELDYGPLPLRSVISQGKLVRWRRRLATIAAALVAAGAVVGPVVGLHAGQSSQAAASGSYHVTVHAPGPNSPGLIAYGQINQKGWRVTGAAMQLNGRPSVCFRTPRESCTFMAVPKAKDKGSPGDFDFTTAGGIPMALIGSVRADVRQVRVSLSNGQTLTLKPVPIFGKDKAAWVALMVPQPATITKITAYSAKGKVGYAIPFGRGPLFSSVRWLSPGVSPWPKLATYRAASGTLHRKHWAENVYIGPWGYCVAGTGVGMCSPQPLGRILATGYINPVTVVSAGKPTIGYNVFITSRRVGYVIVHFSKSHSIRLRLVRKGPFKFAGFTTSQPYAASTWDGYSASGKLLVSGGEGTVTGGGTTILSEGTTGT